MLAACVFASCNGDGGVTLEAYSQQVAALTATLDAGNKEAVVVDGAPGGIAGARYAQIEQRLRAYAAGLDALRAPGDASDAHHDLTVASKNLADAARRFAADATPPADDAIVRAGRFVEDWVRACHTLQDLALAREIDADLRCATALQQG